MSEGCDFSLSCPSFSRRPIALKVTGPSKDFTAGRGPVKKLVTCGLRASCREEFGRGLELALGLPPGRNVLAAGFGLNSCARTLNLEMLDGV